MNQPDARFRFIDLFAGLGGFHVALAELGGQGVFAAEWEPTLNSLYKTNFGIAPWSDVSDLDSDAKIALEIPDHDVLTAGFPCQPFSKAGEQLGFEHTLQGQLFFKVFEILKVKRPRRFILENVPNILKHDNGNTLKTIKNKLGKSSKWQDLQLVGSLVGITIAAAGAPDDIEDRIEASADVIRLAANDEWTRPEKTQTRTQWDYIARIVEDIVEKLDVDITAASEAIRTRFGSSGVESLLGSKLPPKDE